MALPVPARARKLVERWLWLVAVLIAAMVVVGGATRLTGSGLSITEWRPVTGVIPPLTDAAWREELTRYRASPQARLVNVDIDLSAYRAIFWWEWAHRLLARLLGLVVVVPLAVLWRRRALPRWLVRRCIALVALGAVQGALGWLMVQSGLVDVPRVSHYRLAAHLLTALVTLGLTVWTALEVRFGRARPRRSVELASALGLLVLVALQVVWGALVAGLRSGILFPTFPTMNGAWVPPGVGAAGPWWSDALENPITVQLVHRALAAVLAVTALGVAALFARRPSLRAVALLLAGAVSLQIALGALTVLRFVYDPVPWGVAHQAGAIGLVVACVLATFRASAVTQRHPPIACVRARPTRPSASRHMRDLNSPSTNSHGHAA